MIHTDIDIKEEGIVADFGEDVLLILLREHAYDRNEKEHNKKHHIYWATNNYEQEGMGFNFFDEIQIENITGKYNSLIRPRASKTKEEQEKRTRDKAEVFTPSWICNKQNNLVDEEWFGRKDVFNTEIIDAEGHHDWIPNEEKIIFPDDKKWEDYVLETRLEIACGEAPYLVSRYDTTTGEPIDDLLKRVGLLDRKLRIVSENVTTQKDWIFWAIAALKSIYGFEWQGDNLLLAREAILYTFQDYYKEFVQKYNIKSNRPSKNIIKLAAKIISWNIFQMDGIKMVLPLSCHDDIIKGEQIKNLFEDIEIEDKIIPCFGCKKNDIHAHNGIYQLVANWDKNLDEPIEIVEFHTLLKK